jgi:hypothetical protein
LPNVYDFEMQNSINRRQLLRRAILLVGACAASSTAFAAPKSSAPKKMPPKPIAARPPQTVIYALGASLFFQDLDGSAPREEKLDLPTGSKIQYLSGSRDGQTLAFAVKETIYFYNTLPKALTLVQPKDGGKYLYPSISPDGQSVSCRPYRVDATLCILSRDGTVRTLGASTKDAGTSRFTPDGQTIYFSTGPNLMRIGVGGGEAELVVRGNYIENFAINAQGLLVAPIPVDNTAVKPFLVDATGQKTPLTFEPNDFNRPVWSPGGTSVAFSLFPRYGSEKPAQGLYIWKNIKTQPQLRKVSDAQSNGGSGFVWR